MKRAIGDIYRVNVDAQIVAYFQHVADDQTQLCSNVICVFTRRYAKEVSPTTAEIVNDEPEFYAHVAIPVGIKHKCWERIGSTPVLAESAILFRISNEHGPRKVSNDWSVWRANEPLKRVVKLPRELRKAEIGLVVNPMSVVFRIRNGRYDFAYPEA